MKRTLVFGLIGAGEIAVQTAKAISESQNCRIGLVQDINEEMARDLGDKFNAPYCLTWEELLADRSIDAVYIATPHHLHKPAALAAIAAGKHILLEKPIATTLSDTDEIIGAAEKAGVTLSVAFTSRYTDRMQKVKRLIDEDAIGRIVGIDFGAYSYKPDSYWKSGWTGRVETDWRASKEKSGGGVFLMNLVHTIDALRFMTGLDVVSVASNYDTFKTNVEVEDYLVAILRYSNGAIGAARTSTFVEGKTPAGAFEGDRIIGLKGQIVLAPDALFAFFSKGHHSYKAGEWHKICVEDPWGGRTKLVSEFAKAVLARKAPPIQGIDGRKALEVCLAAYKSGSTGEFITLPMVE